MMVVSVKQTLPGTIAQLFLAIRKFEILNFCRLGIVTLNLLQFFVFYRK